jgi:hypothetical protein
MNWDAIGAIGEWAGAIVVIATLFYLAGQVKQSQKMEKAVAQRDLLQRVSEWNRMIHDNSNGTYDNFIQGLDDYDSAPTSVQMCVDTYVAAFVFITEAALNMRQDGFFSDGTWNGIEGGAIALLRTPGGAQWWKHGQLFVGSEIVEHLQQRLQDVPPDTPNFLDFVPTMRRRLEELDRGDVSAA